MLVVQHSCRQEFFASQIAAIVCISWRDKSVRPTWSLRNCFTMSRCTCSFRAVELLNEATVGSLSRRRLRQASWSCWRRRGDRSVSATPLCAEPSQRRRWVSRVQGASNREPDGAALELSA